MTIVASNSLTLSKVNDGTITHTAWSYSADGTDRFTTVYPNLNLLKNTKTKSYISTGTAGNSSSSSDPNAYASDTTAFASALLTISYDYAITNSVGTWSGFIIPTYGIGGTNKAVSSTNLTGSHKETVQIGLSENSKSTIFTLGIPAGTSIKIDNLKIEFGDTASPWIGSKSETKPSDFPNFRGEYSDKLTTQSQTPSDYKWLVFQGPTGATGAKGDPTGITKSATEPENKFDGMIWYVDSNVDVPSTNMEVGSAAQSNGQYTWNGTKWSLYMLRSINMMVDNGFITNAMIANAEIDNAKIKDATIESAKIKSINADKIAANSLAAISAILGDVTAGTYTSWNFSDAVVYKYLNGVYLYDGHLRSIAIENSTVTDPNKNLTSKSYLIRGSDVYGGMVTFFNNTITTSAKPNDLLKGSSFFNGSNQASVLDSSRDASGASALDIRSDNVRITGYASQTIPWTKLTDFAYYKVMFGRVNVRVGLTSGSSRDDIYLGTVPDKYKSPNGEMMLPAQAWSIGTGFDRHVQYNANGSLHLINPEPNTKYVFEASYTL